ncbi:hypothetical protein MO973_37770 [Paenibacillus sp. TRM 82003]|nr:hypothetical protein [Paenibacillus sp. TRM 82003]
MTRALDVAWADRRWCRLHAPLGDVGNFAEAVFLNTPAEWFFVDHSQVQVATVAHLRSGAPADAVAGRTAARARPERGPHGGDRGTPEPRLTQPPSGPDLTHLLPSAEEDQRRRREVIADLSTRSSSFRRLWAGLRVSHRPRTHYEVRHPDVGHLILERTVRSLPGGGWQDLIHPGPGTGAVDSMVLLDLL